MHVHFIGVSGTGMGALAELMRKDGHRVTGSDTSFDAPIGPRLAEAGVECLRGYDPVHLDTRPDAVVVGNVIRKDNPEVARARELGLSLASMSETIRESYMKGRRAVVIAGTHGKTTTTTMVAQLLSHAGLEPGYFIGGVPLSLDTNAQAGRRQRSLTTPGATRTPFVIEGDEYDAVFWKKEPKFFDYVDVSPDDIAVVTSVEQDHIDIYPDRASYERAFAELARRMPKAGRLYADVSSDAARQILAEHASCPVTYYGLSSDARIAEATWHAYPGAVGDDGRQAFDVFVGGSSLGRFHLSTPGEHNIRNATAAIALAMEAFGLPVDTVRTGVLAFRGVRRRQDLLGEPGGVRVYDDFAHHPTAVRLTLEALREKHKSGRLFAVFEPRSATACRNLHQAEYAKAFGSADRVVIAPLGRTNIAESEVLDREALVRAIGDRATAPVDIQAIATLLGKEARAGDTIALLSNGAFGGLASTLVSMLESDRARA